MAKIHYNGDSPCNPHPLLTAAGSFLPPDGIAARTASALPPHEAGLPVTSITNS